MMDETLEIVHFIVSGISLLLILAIVGGLITLERKMNTLNQNCLVIDEKHIVKGVEVKNATYY